MADRFETLVEAHKLLQLDVFHELRDLLTRLNMALGSDKSHTPSDASLYLDRVEREADRVYAMSGS